MFNKMSVALCISLLFRSAVVFGMKPAVDNQQKNAEVALGVESAWVSLPAGQEDDARKRIALTEQLNTMAVADEPCDGYPLEREKSCKDLCQENMTTAYGVYLISEEDFSKESIDELFDNCACPILMQRWVEDKTFWSELRKAHELRFIAESKKSAQH